MRPRDCRTVEDLSKLSITAIGSKEDSMTVTTQGVVLKIGCCKLQIDRALFRWFAEWYLEDQKEVIIRSCLNNRLP